MKPEHDKEVIKAPLGWRAIYRLSGEMQAEADDNDALALDNFIQSERAAAKREVLEILETRAKTLEDNFPKVAPALRDVPGISELLGEEGE